MKKYIAGFITGFTLCLGVTVFAAAPMVRHAAFTDTVVIEINGVRQNVEVVSVVKVGEDNARNYASVFDLGIAMGAAVNWNGERGVVEIMTNQQALGTVIEPIVQQETAVQEVINMDEWINILSFETINGLRSNGIVRPNYLSAGFFTGANYVEGEQPILTVSSDNIDTLVRIIKIDGNETDINSYYLNKTDLLRAGFKVE